MGNFRTSELQQKDHNDFVWLAVVLIIALAIRLIFFTGFFGSDEVTYLGMAHSITQNVWQSKENYIGTLRYGVNIPMAISMWSLGPTQIAAGLWSLVTSVGEVGLVFVAARQFWGSRAAIFSALCLAFTPLHVHFAGRLMADSPLAFFVTAAFFLVWRAGSRPSVKDFITAGFAVGALYWIKDAVFYISILVLGVCVLAGRFWHKRWLVSIVAAIAVVIANHVFMWFVYDDPFYLFQSVQRSLQAMPSMPKTSPFFYINYLLLDVRHLWILSYCALGGAIFLLKPKDGGKFLTREHTYILIWFFGFLIILSSLVLRQSNYMLIFLAPLALLGGYFLSILNIKTVRGVVAILVAGGAVLSAFEQQAVEAFTANSRATVIFSNNNSDAQIYASVGAMRADTYMRLTSDSTTHLSIRALKGLEDLLKQDKENDTLDDKLTTVFAVMDPQMLTWSAKPEVDWNSLLSSGCLTKHSNLNPAPLGIGRYVADSALFAAAFLPAMLSERLSEKLQSTLRPKIATVYSVALPCRLPPTSVEQTKGAK